MEMIFTKEIEEKVNIALPCFVKFGAAYWKILNDTKVIKVDNYGFSKGIEVKELIHDNPFKLDGYEMIDEKEFDEAFKKVLTVLNELD